MSAPEYTYVVDSHCHLNFEGLKENVELVLKTARLANVQRFLSISTKMSEFGDVHAIAKKHEGVYCTVGIHPHEAEKEVADLNALIDCATFPEVIGIGETGLDYFYEHSPRDAQKANFRTHIEAAREAGLPLIVHTREADDDTFDILAEGVRAGGLTGLIHCFTASVDFAKKALDLGFYISFSGILTFKNAETVREAALIVPFDRLLVETDSPYLAPVPHRGKPCQPAFTADTLRFLADLRGVSEQELTAITTANFYTLFSKATEAGT